MTATDPRMHGDPRHHADDIARLMAEVEAWRGMEAARDAAVRMMQDALDDLRECKAEVVALRAEAERLRAEGVAARRGWIAARKPRLPGRPVIPAARLRLVLAAAGIVPTAACGGATPSRPKPTDMTAVASTTTLAPQTSAPEVVPTASGAGDTTTTEPETVTTVTIAAPPAAPATTRRATTTTVAVPAFVMPEAATPESDAEYWARQPGYRPSTRDALLACIRSYEQGDAGYATDTGNGYAGAYQFDRQTWASVGGTGNPAHASPAEQDARAWALYESRGLSPWPTPARRCG